MKYGCIGEHLKHSFSKEIHNALSDYEYEIKEISKDALHDFMTKRDFLAINVTIPYKQAVIPYLYYIDQSAKEIGAVNTIVNRDGLLFGYNTDFYGMSALIEHMGVEVENKKVAILGTGGTSKTANAVAQAHLAREIVTVSRTKSEGVITYDELYEKHSDTQIIINTTPVGMYPDNYSKPVCIDKFQKLSGVVDAIYNPLRSQLIKGAKDRNIACEGGLYMLVAQAVRASEIFLDTKYDASVLESVYEKIKRQKENIVLVGMPSSGKSTVGKLISEKLSRRFVDTDVLIEEKTGMSIPEIFKTRGEEGFRRIEAEVVSDVSKETGIVIATGGGVPLRSENIAALSQNARVYFIDRPLYALLPTQDRPLTSTREEMAKKYNQRYDIYLRSADVRIDADCDVNKVAHCIIGEFIR